MRARKRKMHQEVRELVLIAYQKGEPCENCLAVKKCPQTDTGTNQAQASLALDNLANEIGLLGHWNEIPGSHHNFAFPRFTFTNCPANLAN